MKQFVFLCAFIASVFTCGAQTEVDRFNVGPYVVEYDGQGDVRYRLRDNIDLFEFYELQRDTTIISMATEIPVKHAVEISGFLGANRFASKEIGIEGVWKQKIATNLYFNGGLSLTIGHTDLGINAAKREMFEVGIPLQFELGKLNHQYASLYGSIGIAPTIYTTMNATYWDGEKRSDDVKKSGVLIAPSLEFGGNIPVGNIIMRIGVYGKYKVNCTPSDYDVYDRCAGKMFLGATIGVVL